MYSLRRCVQPALRSVRRFSDVPPPPPPSESTGKEQIIHKKLMERFSPSHLQIFDASGGCGTFFAISIASQEFKGLSMVKQHQLVTRTIKEEIEEIHGVQLKTSI
ncbi:bola-like protein, partial [Favolaschia claudopus]